MKNAQSQIRRMRAEVDRLIRQPRAPETRVHVLRDAVKLVRMRRLALGEERRTGDLWLDPSNDQLRHLHLPWWRVWDRRVTESHFDHYRVE